MPAFSSGDDDVDLRRFRLLIGRIRNMLPIDNADADAAEHVLKTECRRSRETRLRR